MGGSGEGFWEGLGHCWVDFRAFKTSQIFVSKLKPEKVVSKSRKVVRGGVRVGSVGPNKERQTSIVDIVHRQTSIVGIVHRQTSIVGIVEAL